MFGALTMGSLLGFERWKFDIWNPLGIWQDTHFDMRMAGLPHPGLEVIDGIDFLLFSFLYELCVDYLFPRQQAAD